MNDLQTCVRQFKNHDHQQFETFYHLTKKAVFYSIIAIVKDENLVEDIMQETYLKFLKNIHYVKENGNIQAYLNQMARHLAIDLYHQRKKTVYDDAFIDMQQEPVAEDPPDDTILLLLDHLDPNEKEVIIQHVINELKFREIAELLKKPLGTILWIYNKGIKKLRKEVEKSDEKE